MQMCPDCLREHRDSAKFCQQCGVRLKSLLDCDALLPSQRGKYRVLKVLGCGGFGAVSLAEALHLDGRRVAVKENFDTSPDAHHLFRQEATMLERLDHPALPKVYDHFTHTINSEQRRYLAMEFVDGQDLMQVLDESDRPLPEAQVMGILPQVLAAVEYLHGQHPDPIIHRDVSPDNTVITADGQVKLVDLGIAKVFIRGQKTVKALQGQAKPGFTPPEQYGGGSGTDTRSDVYALGTTLYCLLTGEIPPESVKIAQDPDLLIPPRTRNPAISQKTGNVILKAMAIKADDRFQSAAEMRQALLVAPPQSPPQGGGAAPPSAPLFAGRCAVPPTGRKALAAHRRDDSHPAVGGRVPDRAVRDGGRDGSHPGRLPSRYSHPVALDGRDAHGQARSHPDAHAHPHTNSFVYPHPHAHPVPYSLQQPVRRVRPGLFQQHDGSPGRGADQARHRPVRPGAALAGFSATAQPRVAGFWTPVFRGGAGEKLPGYRVAGANGTPAGRVAG